MMNVYTFIEKHIIGQNKLKQEIALYTQNIKDDNNLNILIRGSSGYGKTHIAKVMCNYIGIEQCFLYLGEDAYFLNKNYRISILDEAHEIKEPEQLYPIMDNGDYTFIILTNEYGELKEPFVNRCISINLLPYSNDEISFLIQITLKRSGYILPIEMADLIAKSSRGNPRVAKVTAKRLALLFKKVGLPSTQDELKEMLRIYFNLTEDGFNEFDKMYLSFLKTNKVAGIETLTRILCLPKQTIQAEIEPFLIKNNLIRITSRGRLYIGD